MLKLQSVSEMHALVGKSLGTSSWHQVTQEAVAAFAEVTDDFTPIHIDPEAGIKAGLGGTIAHGLYTLSLGPKFLHEIYTMSGHSLALNYGFEKVRFLSPVPVGSRIRMNATLTASSKIAGGYRFTITEAFEIEGQEKPACVAESVVAYFD